MYGMSDAGDVSPGMYRHYHASTKEGRCQQCKCSSIRRQLQSMEAICYRAVCKYVQRRWYLKGRIPYLSARILAAACSATETMYEVGFVVM